MARRALALTAVALVAAACGSTAPKSAGHKPPKGKTRPEVAVKRIGSLPEKISKASAVALPHGRLLLLGGLVGNTSISTIYQVTPSLRVVGNLPQPTHDAAAALLGGDVYLFGGGSSVSEPSVVRVDPSTGAATEAPALGEPLSDLGAVSIGENAYLAGGFTGSRFASAILRYSKHGGATVITRLPTGTRYAGVTAINGTIYIAGGLTTSGPTRDIYAVPPGQSLRLIGKLPAPQDHSALAALNGELYYVGGRKVLAIDPSSGKVTVAARLPAFLSDPTATTVGGDRIVVTGGGTNGIWRLTPR